MINLIGCFVVGFVVALVPVLAVRFGFSAFAGSGRGSILADIQ